MKYFEKYFSNVDFYTGAEEVSVLCPFHDDTKPSASINTRKNVFNCLACGKGYSEAQFIAKVNDISLSDAVKVLKKLDENASQTDWQLTEKAELWANEAFLKRVEELGLSRNTIDKLDLGIIKDELGRLWLGIPIIYNGVIMDKRSYNLLKIENEPKMKALPGSKSGFVFPYDLWKNDDRTTYIFEGEKDTMLARELGINGICLTGGAGAVPNEFVLNSFKDRNVIICYDNDKAGREGSLKLYNALRNVAKSVKYVDISEVVKEDKGDFHDFIMKYNKDIFDFYALAERDFPEVEIKKNYVSLVDALANNKIKQKLTSVVAVTATFEEAYAVPKYVTLEKEFDTKKGTMLAGESVEWVLEENNLHQLLSLVEQDAKTSQVLAKIKQFAGIGDEPAIKMTVHEYATVYKSRITDATSNVSFNSINVEDEDTKSIDLYSYTSMTVGGQYEIEYKLHPHPSKNQKIVAVASKVSELDSTVNFKPDKTLLSQFISDGTVEERLDKLYQSAKHYIAKHLNYELWLMSDLVFNSILEFDYGQRIRGALDVFILGDTQVGKSETTSKLTELYNFGHFLSLKTSTTVGLIGGSNKVDGNWMNTIGAIPRQHKKLVVLEEFSGAKPEFIKTMTDIRSSGKLRLARAAGEMNVPCRLRMITISNPLNDENGNPRHLSSFPNGVIPLMELIKSAEDVARYDGFLLIPKPKKRVNPFSYKLQGTKIPKEAYEHKIKWVYTRKPEDVVFEEGVESYIWEQAERLNSVFECNFPLFGTTTSLKLARFSVAMASLLMNTDETFEKVIVTKEIVDYTVDFMFKLYDNEVFKLREYKEEYDNYNTITTEELEQVQELYRRNSTIFDFLEHQTMTTSSNLRSVSGLNADGFNSIFNKMVQLKLIRLSGVTVYPTEKFRLALSKIDRSVQINTTDSLIDSML